MVRVLSIDPSGTGASGLFFISENQKEFYQVQKETEKTIILLLEN